MSKLDNGIKGDIKGKRTGTRNSGKGQICRFVTGLLSFFLFLCSVQVFCVFTECDQLPNESTLVFSVAVLFLFLFL